MGAPGLADGYYWFERHNVRKTVQFFPHFRTPYVWGRGAQTTGWAYDPKFAMPWCDVVPGTIQGNTATLETYCYKVYRLVSDGTISGITYELIGWYPCAPSQVQYAFTTHGENMGFLFKKSIKDNKNLLPTKTKLENNYPNPFNPSTTIKYQLSEPGFVTLKVYDMLGQEVANLVNEQKGIGFYEAKFDAGKLTSGIYFYTIRVNDYTASKKMILTK
ncbi:MAG: hypothetical protein CR986_07975 [Ignavibacteriae bacterium]|nr:MAG: hypothetical protein CR986_07975 [Ignavibacteriota bacterium]